MTSLLLAAVALATVTPGPWTGSTGAPHARAHARVTFEVLPGGGVIQPFVRVDLRGCRSTRTVHLRRSFGSVGVSAARFTVRTTFRPPGRAMRVRLRLAGHFRSAVSARGTLRGRVRYAGGHICRIPRLTWTTHPLGDDPVAADDPAADDEDFIEDDDGTIEDGDYEEDDPADPGDDGDNGDDEDPGDDPGNDDDPEDGS
jgi:hypothetical protein